MKSLLTFFFAALLCAHALPLAAGERVEVSVTAAYIEMHTGPGRGYPVFHVVERGEVVEVLKRRTDWFKIRTRKGQQGWVDRNQMEQTLDTDGEVFIAPEAGFADYTRRRWELGVMGGEYAGANSLSVFGGYRMTANLGLELRLNEITGSFSDSTLVTLNIVHQFFPRWRATPYFVLGAGAIQTRPSATIVATEDRMDNTLNAGLGARMYITRRFLARFEYRSHVILTSRDDNEDADQWEIGFSVFF